MDFGGFAPRSTLIAQIGDPAIGDELSCSPACVTPLILTTAFVIFGAWRRAVRDAESEKA